MKQSPCKICAQSNRQRPATGNAVSRAFAKYAAPTPVCDECGKAHEAKGGKVEWKTKQKKLAMA